MNIRTVNYETLFKEAVDEVIGKKYDFARKMAIKDILEKLEMADLSQLFNPKIEILPSETIKNMMKKAIEESFYNYIKDLEEIRFEENICYAEYEIQKMVETMFYIYKIEDNEEIHSIINWLYG